MIYVYSKAVRTKTQREDMVGLYETWEQELERITALYMFDHKTADKGQYYYFAKER